MPRSTFVGLNARPTEIAEGSTVSVADAHSLVTLLASMVRARYSTVAGHTLLNVDPVSSTFVQTLPTFFCHSHATGSVAFVTTALTTLGRLCVTTDGENVTVTAG